MEPIPSSGYSQRVYWGDESSYGSPATVSKDLGAVQSISPAEKNNVFKVRTLGGNRDYKTIVPGKFEISGSMDYLLQGGAFLRQAWGEDTASTATVDSGPRVRGATTYTHVLGSANSPGVNSFPSFTLEFTDYEDAGGASTSNLKRTYIGCRVNSLKISGAIDTPLKCTADWLAKRVIVSTADASSVTEYTTDPFVFYEGAVFLTSGAVTDTTPQSDLKSDSGLAQVLSFDFTLNNNAEAGWYISGTTGPNDTPRSARYIVPKGRDYDLKLGLHYKNREMYQRFLGAINATTDSKTMDKFTIVLDSVKSGTPGTVANGDHFMRLVLASAMFNDIGINGAPEDIVGTDLTVFTKSVKCFFIDNVSDYS